MNKLLLFGAFIFGIYSSAQMFTAMPSRLMPEDKIISLEGISNKDIYQRVIKWVNITFKNPDKVLKSNIENDLVKVNGIWNIDSRDYFGRTQLDLEYTMQIDIKDQKIRVNIYDLKGLGNFKYYLCFKNNGERRDTKEVRNYLISIEKNAEAFIFNLINYIKENSNSDW
ncbi:DUF4468 domain-containing protein [Elizabethkingia ursingii]|uniref:DUF4468 domain-containing protein n=1 Tax=Elizabethkingia ursingii TaxID=1756150 RepID=A0AAJ3TN44_9FLAO|nr:DUF4468 domain-containing protein [Elizabethkingia ursingii]AQX08033.1 hypothetical protein BBD34_04960 [Elizabethkingia ursingii]OPB73613.1 hypothetical protein BAY32_11260 [Elizabethkingia ursingii]